MSILNNTNLLNSLLEQANNLPDATQQATPEISVASSGLITATAGEKFSTYQLAFQEAKTITPSTASQIAVSSGYYTGGNIIVAGDSNLTAENIVSGVSIFGVEGSAETGNTDMEDSLVTRDMTSYTNSRVTTIGSMAFQYCSSLTSVSFPACISIGSWAFYYCHNLTTASFPVCTSIGSSAFNGCSSLTAASFSKCTYIGSMAFQYCTSLTSVSFPACISIGIGAFYYCHNLTTASFPVCTSIDGDAFRHCSSLTTASFPACTSIGSMAFRNCRTLSSLTLGASTVCTLSHSNAFSSTPYAGYKTYFSGTPYIYVPSSLVASYQTATNWTYFSSYFSAIKETGGTGIYSGGTGS